jgi:hypothetical protein
MATTRRTAHPSHSILGLPQSSAIAPQADPQESGTALAATSDDFSSEFNFFRSGVGPVAGAVAVSQGNVFLRHRNEPKAGKIVEEGSPRLPRNGHDAMQQLLGRAI